MDTLTTRLKQQTEGMDTSGMTPAEHLPGVISRGKRYLVMMSAATIVGTTAAVAGAAVVVPQIVEELRGPDTPVVVSTPEDEPAPEVIETEEPEKPTEPAPTNEEKTEPFPAVPEEEPQAAPADVTPPELAVLSPADGSTVDEKEVLFSGEVEPGSTVKAGPYEATVKDDGSWSIVLIASKGANDVTFTATDEAGNVTTKTITVTYAAATASDDKKEPTQDEKPAADGVLTANQQSSELTSAPHKNVYWGTASPEAKVAVTSEYGTAYTWADSKGNWEVLVDFDPPAGTTTFPVKVKLYHQPEVRRTFELTTVAEGSTKVFTANQQSSTLDGEPYTNVYWGTANPGEKIKVISDYGWDYVYADESGNWELAVTFNPPGGTKTFNVTARYYHDSSVNKTFTLTTVAPEAAAFTATQKESSVSASAPTNSYCGTGQPGHEILIWTEAHGQVSTVVDGSGNWEVDLTYSGVAKGDTFQVKAKDLNSGTKHYFEVTITE